MNNRAYLENLLRNLEEKYEMHNNQLKMMPKETLWVIKRNNKETFFECKKVNGKRERKAINKNPQRISEFFRKELLIAENDILEEDIKLINKMLEGYIETSIENIVARLPEKHKEIIEKEYIKNGGRYSPVVLEWAHSKYNQSDYMRWERKHKTSKGLLVRSKSELMIAEKLYQYGIPFRYEETLHFEDVRMIPDFVVPGKKYDFYYWEHCGMMNNEEYLANYHKKMKQYEKLGITPWTNLIVTYDDEYGNIDMAVIEGEIRNKLKWNQQHRLKV